MGDKIVECVPNISEGRDYSRIERIVNAVKGVPGVHLLHIDSGKDANRTVLTFAGSPAAVAQGALALVEEAQRQIDISGHQGAHPRIGAVDVCPFVPLQEVTAAECVEMAHDFAHTAAELLGIPVFLYGKAAPSGRTRFLWQIRKGGLGRLAQRLDRGEIQPAYGPAKLEPRFGAMAVGARDVMIAFNVTLNCRNLEAAERIAMRVRERFNADDSEIPDALKSCCGLAGVQAIGWDMPSFNASQVSMNLTRPEAAGMHQAYESVKKWAEHFGVEAAGGELIGLACQAHFEASGAFYSKGRQEGKTLMEWAASAMKLDHLSDFEARSRTIEGAMQQGSENWIRK